jgi:hypothetical protein
MMKTLFKRFGIVLLVLALMVSAVFAQEEAAPAVNSFTFVLVIIGGGIGAVALLGYFMRDTNNNKDNKSE